jgi:hypothetical protein
VGSTRMRSLLFYAGCLLVLVVLATKALTHVLPGTLAHELDDESEALPIALLFCAYIQFVRRPRAAGSPQLWLITVVLAALSWLVAWLLLTLSLPSSLATLNESFVAVGVMILYACPARPVRWAPLLAVAVLGAMVALHSTNFVTTQAESLVPIMLSPLAFDWADRSILDPRSRLRASRLVGWCVFLLAVVVVSRVHVDLGSMHDVLRYPRRATEGLVALLLVHAYFSFWLRDRRFSPEGNSTVTLPGGDEVASEHPAVRGR